MIGRYRTSINNIRRASGMSIFQGKGLIQEMRRLGVVTALVNFGRRGRLTRGLARVTAVSFVGSGRVLIFFVVKHFLTRIMGYTLLGFGVRSYT